MDLSKHYKLSNVVFLLSCCIHVLSVNYSIGADQLIDTMRDRASVNNVAMRTLSIVYPNLIDIRCFAHTLDRVGEHFSTCCV
jgi:hypothetical protein